MVSINTRFRCPLCKSIKTITEGEGTLRIKRRLCEKDCPNDNQELFRMNKKPKA